MSATLRALVRLADPVPLAWGGAGADCPSLLVETDGAARRVRREIGAAGRSREAPAVVRGL